MTRSAQISYVLLALVFALCAWLHLGTFLLTSLLGYLALRVFTFRRNKALSVGLYLIAVVILTAGLLYLASLAYRTFPRIADLSIPAMVEFAERNGIELPFTDYASLKASALAGAREGIAVIGRYASIASLQSILLVAGLVVGLTIYLNPFWGADGERRIAAGDLYSDVTRELSLRFRNLYEAFARVMGAQIIISAINTALTAVFLVFSGYPFPALLLGLVFLCGMLPIIGNIISNTVIVGVGFTMSPKAGLIALLFLIAIHKLEYFLNSRIIGARINSPMWLTLIGLVVGERLMGISGMVLAPVVLYYIKCEASSYSTRPAEAAEPEPEPALQRM